MAMRKSCKRKISLAIAGILLLTACSTLDSAENTESTELPKIIVGFDIYPPYYYEDKNGGVVGIDAELAREAFDRLGYQPEFVQIDWENKTELVDSGSIDCVWGSFSIDGREQQYNWTEPYLYSRQVIAVCEESDIQTLADLEDCRVAVQSTTKPESMFLAGTDPRLPKLREVISVQERELIYSFLSKGYVDAIAAHEVSIERYCADYDLHYRIIEEPLRVVGLGAAFSKNDSRGIEKQLSEVFRQMRDDGSLEEILAKYLDEPQRYLEVTPDA